MKIVCDPDFIKFLFSNFTFFSSNFIPIVSTEQRTQYKAVYSESYTKYLKLHKVLESITQKAAALEDQLKRTTRGSSQFKVQQKAMSRIADFLLHIRVGANPCSLMTSEPNECSYVPRCLRGREVP